MIQQTLSAVHSSNCS